MNGLNEIWAKSTPKETLEEHTNAVLEIWSQLRERYLVVLKDEKFWRDSFYAVAFHDFGKICDNFQEAIKGKRAFNDDERIRHEFFSGMFLFSNNHKHYQLNPESLIAVFSHHKPFNEDGFNKHIFRNTTLKYCINKDLIDEFIEFINVKAKLFGIEPLPTSKNLKYFVINEYSELTKWYQRKIYDEVSQQNALNISNRNIYIYYKAILNISDWTASGHIPLEKGKQYDIDYLKRKIIVKLLNEGKENVAKNFTFRTFQKEVVDRENIIAIAPTGSGKTEASLLWASNKNDWERIIYLLPTRVTSNAIYQRMISYFGTDKVQLIHSSARLFIKDQIDNDYDQKNYFRDKSFFKNINVCTVDQILTLGFNLGYWEVKTFHTLNARIIIDEIHLYSPYTLGLIISTIKYLKENFNARFFIMTATLPQKLMSLLQDAIENVKVIKDSELLNSSRNTFETRDVTIDNLQDEIEEHIFQKQKVLVVVNTVDKAIELFEHFEKIADKAGVKAICYHSRFVNKHRSKKEKDIFDLEAKNNGGILIATQVVEVSLDIDFDILFTENAPIDAIIQRAGRVNRKRQKENSKVIITKHFDISEIIYDTGNVMQDTFLEFKKVTGQKLTENELTLMVDHVYESLDIVNNKDYQEGLTKHLDIQYKYNFIKDLTSDEKVFTRENLDTVSVIPHKFYEKLYDCEDKDGLTKYELNISRKRSFSSRLIPGPFGFKFIDANYSYKKGLVFNKNTSASMSC